MTPMRVTHVAHHFKVDCFWPVLPTHLTLFFNDTNGNIISIHG